MERAADNLNFIFRLWTTRFETDCCTLKIVFFPFFIKHISLIFRTWRKKLLFFFITQQNLNAVIFQDVKAKMN